MSYLNKNLPLPSELFDLDSFDTAFLVLTGYVQFVPVEALVMKAAQAVKKDVILWGPESKLIAYILRKAWKKHGIKLTDAVIAAFDLTGDISVEPKKVKAAFKKYGNVGEEVTRTTKKKVLQTLARIAKKATKHYKKQIEKARVQKQEEKELWAILGGQLDTYVEMYPDRVLTKEVERLVTLTMTAPDRRAVNAITLRNRIENIANHPLNYMDNVSDIHAGRAWHFTGLRMAQSEGITTAIVIAQEDKVTCPVCLAGGSLVLSPDGITSLLKLSSNQILSPMGLTSHEGLLHKGVRPVLDIIGERGYTISPTEEHEMFVLKNDQIQKIPASKVLIGDHMVLKKGGISLLADGIEHQQAGELFGFLAGDGSINFDSRKISCVVSGENPQFASCIESLWHNVFGNDCSMFVDNRGLFEIGGRSNHYFDILSYYGLRGNKFEIPICSSSAFYRGYLRGLFSADGTITDGGKGRYTGVSLYSIKLDFLKKIQVLLLLCGVASKIGLYHKRNDKRMVCGHLVNAKDLFTLRILGGHNLDTFHIKIGFLSNSKKNEIDPAGFNGRQGNSLKIPLSNDFLDSVRTGIGLEPYFYYKEGRCLNTASLACLIDRGAFDSSFLERIVNEQYFFEEVVQIKNERSVYVFDVLSVKDPDNSFIANGFKVSNCRRMDGRRIEVARSIERMEDALSLTNPDEISKALPFPRVHNLDNMSPKQIMNAGWTIPFHNRCRCDFEYLWSEGIRVAEPGMKLSERSERALATHKPCTRDVQVMALANEKGLVHMIPGAKSIGGKKPFDVWVTPARRKKPTDVIEVKTIVRGKNNKITMHKDSLLRKQKELKKLKNPRAHTVVFDERTGKYYHRKGLGSFRLTQMTEVNTLEEMKYLVTGKKKTHKKVLDDLEANIRHKRDVEVLYAINKKGDVVFAKEGTKAEISFGEKERKLFKGCNWTHNHPGESSFSADDIYMMLANETPECRAVCSHYRYSAKIDWKAAAKSPRVKKNKQALVDWILNEDYVYAEKEVRKMFEQAIRSGTLTIKEANAMHYHEIWTIVARINPFFSYSQTGW